MAGPNQNPEQGNLVDTMESWYPAINLLVGLDARVKDALDADPDFAKSVYARLNKIGSEQAIDTAKIDTQKLADSLTVQEKSALLLNHFVGDYFFREKNAFAFKSVDQVRESYRTLAKNPAAFASKEFEGYPHLLIPPNLFKMDVDFFKGDAPPFDLPLQTRIVLDTQFSPFAITILKGAAVKAGKKVSLLYPGDLPTASKPGPNECQIVLCPSQDDLNKEIDWSVIDLYAEAWEDTVPLIGMSPELVASVYVKKGKTPEEACKTAGLDEPEAKFLDQLKTVPKPDPAKADDLNESL